MFRKIVSLILFMISLTTLIFYFVSLGQLSDALGVELSLDTINEIFDLVDSEASLYMLSLVLNTFFDVFGMPLILLGVSVIGLTLPSKH